MIACRARNPYSSQSLTAHLDLDILQVTPIGEDIKVETIVYKTGKFLSFGNVLFYNSQDKIIAKGSVVGHNIYSKDQAEFNKRF